MINIQPIICEWTVQNITMNHYMQDLKAKAILPAEELGAEEDSLTEQCPTWKSVWSQGMEFNSFMWKKWHPLTVFDGCWMLMETKEWKGAQWGGAFQQQR